MSLRATQIVAGLSLALAVVAIGLSMTLAIQLRRAQAAVAPIQSVLEEMVGEDGSIRTEIRIPAGTPISLDIPIDERVAVRVDTIIGINTTVDVPLRSPLGNYRIPVPIRSQIPIRATVPIRIRHTFRLRTSTAEDLFVPVVVGE